MTCNTSVVAVCCSNASRVSVNSRAFSIAITACVAKFCNSAICVSVKGRTSCRLITKAPTALPSFTNATQIIVRTPDATISAAASICLDRYASCSAKSNWNKWSPAMTRWTNGWVPDSPCWRSSPTISDDILREAARRARSPSKVQRIPLLPSQSRTASSSIASNTGVRSPGEELMTCNTSAVAVCCSRASRVSHKSRAFSIAITAWAAKFWSSAICCSVKGRTSCRYSVKIPSSLES